MQMILYDLYLYWTRGLSGIVSFFPKFPYRCTPSADPLIIISRAWPARLGPGPDAAKTLRCRPGTDLDKTVLCRFSLARAAASVTAIDSEGTPSRYRATGCRGRRTVTAGVVPGGPTRGLAADHLRAAWPIHRSKMFIRKTCICQKPMRFQVGKNQSLAKSSQA
jgi:hypothetical protein